MERSHSFLGPRSFLAKAVLLSSLVNGACQREGIDSSSLCQFQSTNDVWKNYGFNLVVNQPPPGRCPVKIDFAGQNIDFAAVVDAPYGTPVSPFVYRFFDAREVYLSQGLAYFGTAPNGREAANVTSRYLAGWQGPDVVQQDRVNTQVGVYQTAADAINDTWLPYQIGGVISSIARVPRAKVGRATTLRIYPNGVNASRYEWHLNGVDLLPKRWST